MTDDVRLKILMVATEAVPFAKEGGVADVMGSLPKELAALGLEVRVFIPRYGSIDPRRWELKPAGIGETLLVVGGHRYGAVWQALPPESAVTVYLRDHEQL